MAAFVEHDFPRGFVLDEERIRKLHEIVTERLEKIDGSGILHFKIYRGDSYSYETSSVDDVVGEDNDDWRRITKLKITTKAEGVDPHLDLDFSSNGSTLSIYGQDRDEVFLLFSDLKSYMEEQVLTKFHLDRDTTRLVGILLPMAAMLITILYVIVTLNSISSELFIEPPSVNSELIQKVNYLVEATSTSHRLLRASSAHEVMPWGFAIAMLLMIASVSGVFYKIVNYVIPSNVFLFGKQKKRHESRRDLISKVFWTVVIGLAVGIAATVLAR